MATYINFLSGFNVTTPSSIDRRLFLSKQEMKTLFFNDLDPVTGRKIKINVPDQYFCFCTDDKKMYIYIKGSTAEEETGCYHLLENYIDLNQPILKDDLTDIVAEGVLTTDNPINEAVGDLIKDTKLDVLSGTIDGGQVTND